MDTCSAADVARQLNTSVPRVVRAARRLGLKGRPGARSRWDLTQPMVECLSRELGYTPTVDGLSGVEVRVLAALARAPLGLASVRVVGGEATVSPTSASKALSSLVAKGLAYREPATIAAGRARDVELVHANRRATAWLELAPRLAAVRPPARERARQRKVPPRLAHLFWNTAPSQLDLDTAGPYIARRLLTTADLEGLAWGAENLRAADWERAARARGLDRRARALAVNLAKAR